MPIAFIPAPLRGLTAGHSRVEVEGASVSEVIEALEARFPGIATRLRRGDSLAPGIQVSVDHVMSSRGLHASVGPDSEVHFLPAIGGGSPSVNFARDSAASWCHRHAGPRVGGLCLRAGPGRG